MKKEGYKDFKKWALLLVLFFGCFVINTQLTLAETTPDGTNSSDAYSMQQQIEVSGTVTDAQTGDPLPGVNIVIQGTTQGATTDMDGNYTIEAPADATLEFSFVGYQTKTVNVEGRQEINVTLQQSVTELEEVVAIGYGSQKKSDLTGGVSTVSGDDIANRKTTTVSQALQGTSAGVMVRRSNEDPGSGASIRIRGITTIGNSEPLIIVDGVQRDNIDDINPNNIANISVLKDASSASIYGARAASGVILITTKRAESGELSVNYNIEYGIEKPTETPEYVGAVRYMELNNELKWNDNGNNEDEYPVYSQDLVSNYNELNAENPNEYPITDWQDLVMNDYAPRQRHNLDITGGTENVKLKGSLSYENIDGLYYGRNYQRLNSRLNTDITLKEEVLDAKMDVYFRRDIQERPIQNPVYRARMSAPIYAAKWSDGRIAGGKQGANIYGIIKQGGFRNNWDNQLGGKLELNYRPLNGLELSGRISPSLGFQKGKNFTKRVPYYDPENPARLLGYLEHSSSTELSESRSDSYDVTAQFLANYEIEFGGHSLTAMAGHEDYKAFNEYMGASRDQYKLRSYPYLSIGPLEYRDNYGGAYENAYRSWFGRISYNFRNKYLLQGNIRYDGSSRFHSDSRWGTFPSLSAGWVLTEESFMQNTDPLSFLKLRASYGTLGNERIGNYPYQATIGFSDALFYQNSNVVSAQTAAQWEYAIPDITWEKTKTYNIGVDANFFENRLQVIGDYYRKETEDMLLPLEIPDYMGFDNPDQNAGRMHTEGWDLELIWNDNIGDLSYSVSFNLSDSKSVMGELGGIEFKGDQIIAEGTQFNEWYGYKADGLFQSQEEVENSALTNESVRPGDVKYVDISGPN